MNVHHVIFSTISTFLIDLFHCGKSFRVDEENDPWERVSPQIYITDHHIDYFWQFPIQIDITFPSNFVGVFFYTGSFRNLAVPIQACMWSNFMAPHTGYFGSSSYRVISHAGKLKRKSFSRHFFPMSIRITHSGIRYFEILLWKTKFHFSRLHFNLVIMRCFIICNREELSIQYQSCFNLNLRPLCLVHPNLQSILSMALLPRSLYKWIQDQIPKFFKTLK